MSEQTVQAPCVVFVADGWEFRILRNPNPDAWAERFLGYSRNIAVTPDEDQIVMSVSSRNAEACTRALLRKHLGKPKVRRERDDMIATVCAHMARAIKDLRPNS